MVSYRLKTSPYFIHYYLIEYLLNCFSDRLKVPLALVKDTPRHILFVVVAETVPFTIKRRLVPNVDIPLLRPENVIASQSPILKIVILIDYFLVNWSMKGKRRKTTGTGRMRYLKDMPRRFKNGFREGILICADLFFLLIFYFLT